MNKKLIAQISLLKEIHASKNKLDDLVKKDNFWNKNDENKEEKFIIDIIKEFPNNTVIDIAMIAVQLGFPNTVNYISRKIWTLIDRGTLNFNTRFLELTSAKSKKEKK